MKFYLGEGVEIQIAPEVENNISVVKDTTFQYGSQMYSVVPIEFKIDDVYFLFHDMMKSNPGKKIFVHHFEPLANDFYAMYYAVEA